MDVLQMILKCADIGHLAAATHIHKRWAYLLEEEFFRQVAPTDLLVLHAVTACVCCCLDKLACPFGNSQPGHMSGGAVEPA